MNPHDSLPLAVESGCCGGGCTCQPPESDGRVPVYLRAGELDEIEVGRLGAATDLPMYLRDLADHLEFVQHTKHLDDDEQPG